MNQKKRRADQAATEETVRAFREELGLDRPAYEAMSNGGRILDAVKNTVRSINGALDKAIESEEQAEINRERERQRVVGHEPGG